MNKQCANVTRLVRYLHGNKVSVRVRYSCTQADHRGPVGGSVDGDVGVGHEGGEVGEEVGCGTVDLEGYFAVGRVAGGGGGRLGAAAAGAGGGCEGLEIEGFEEGE